MPAQPARSRVFCSVSSPFAHALGPLARQRPQCARVVRGFGAAAVPESGAAANPGFLFFCPVAPAFQRDLPAHPGSGLRKPARGALGWAWPLSPGLTWGLGMIEKFSLPHEDSLAPGKAEWARFLRQNCLHTHVRYFTLPPRLLLLAVRRPNSLGFVFPRAHLRPGSYRGHRAKLPPPRAAMKACPSRASYEVKM